MGWGYPPSREVAVSKKPRKVLTLNEVAEYRRIPRSTAYMIAQEGRIPGQKVDGSGSSIKPWSTNGSVTE
jgi:excisionase family DNA binding protein